MPGLINATGGVLLDVDVVVIQDERLNLEFWSGRPANDNAPDRYTRFGSEPWKWWGYETEGTAGAGTKALGAWAGAEAFRTSRSSGYTRASRSFWPSGASLVTEHESLVLTLFSLELRPLIGRKHTADSEEHAGIGLL
jgi:hypothetical protein